MSSTRDYWTLDEIAEDMGWSLGAINPRTGQRMPGTAAVYHNRAEKNRREGKPRPGDFPPPTRRFSNVPVWSDEVYQEWKKNRPGRGAGGGRPWHKEG